MRHWDEARQAALEALEQILETAPRASKAVLIDDLFGRLRLVLWVGDKARGETLRGEIDEKLVKECGVYWTGDVWLAQGGGKISEPDRKLYDRSWKDARAHSSRVRLLDRRRNRGAWFSPPSPPIWTLPSKGVGSGGPPVVVFYSFKGGVGRSTSLASFAIHRARAGDRVVVIDADLDAPGLGTLLVQAGGERSHWGVVDYLLERSFGEVELRDYYHTCNAEGISGSGEILVFPSGRIDGDYLDKLARIDLEPPSHVPTEHPLALLLRDLRKEFRPDWILLDTRAGLAEPAGMLLSGLAHLYVLFGTFSNQSWAGLRLVLERLGGDRLRQDLPQADCLMVQAMVPENSLLAEKTVREFTDRARDEFLDVYYAEDSESETSGDVFWSVGDADSSDAPHVPVPLPYSPKLADFGSIEDVADDLAESPDYRRLAARIDARFGGP